MTYVNSKFRNFFTNFRFKIENRSSFCGYEFGIVEIDFLQNQIVKNFSENLENETCEICKTSKNSISDSTFLNLDIEIYFGKGKILKNLEHEETEIFHEDRINAAGRLKSFFVTGGRDGQIRTWA